MTDEVSLRPFTAEMCHAYYKEYENDPDLYVDKRKFTPFVYSPEWVERYLRRQISLNRKCFAIMAGEEMAGELILKNIEPGQSATLGICMKNAAYKDRGFGTRAERLAIDYVFHQLDIPVLYADCILSNTRSRHVLEKLGFRLLREEGDFRYYCIERPRKQALPRWIFFDIGSTLVDEEAACLHRIRDMIRGMPVTLEQFLEQRIRYAKEGFNGDQKAIEHFGLTKTPWPSEDEIPDPDAAATLAALTARGYRLGVIANQNPGAAERLANWGLLRYFRVVAASAELGLAKPDPAIFLRALELADCRPENAVMVGDRLDNDIRPAKALGMRTVRMQKGLAACSKPSCAAELADHSVDSLRDLLWIL